MKAKPSQKKCKKAVELTRRIFSSDSGVMSIEGFPIDVKLPKLLHPASGMTDSGKRQEQTVTVSIGTVGDKKQSILIEAENLINGDRQEQYSHPTDDYTKTVGAFNALTGHTLTAKEGMLFMVCVKLSRECFKAKRDNLVDACGYLGCIEKHEDKISGGDNG